MSSALLLSGGIDSIALMYWKRPDYAITIDYGQLPARAELVASKSAAMVLGVKHFLIEVNCSGIGSGDLSTKKPSNAAPSSEWWPFRNQLLVTLAGAKALELGVERLWVGSVLQDGFHRDGTLEFYKHLNDLMSYQEGGIQVQAPAIDFTTKDLVLKSGIPSSVLFYAHSCHTNNSPCGMCRGCYKYTDTLLQLHEAGWR
ncbi:MAG: 7-cyano-7-deazaguanine synthase [Proteobacteria bacterium]|nr:MAG: 7-cyano-7-deazaguanine synthase [Pseudomonadota bacterium]